MGESRFNSTCIAQDEKKHPSRGKHHIALAVFLVILVGMGLFSWYWPRYVSVHTRHCDSYALYKEAIKRDAIFQPNDILYAFYSDGSAGTAYGLFDWSSGRSSYRPHNITVSPKQIYIGTLTLGQGQYDMATYAEDRLTRMWQGDTVSGLYYLQAGLYVDQAGQPITSYTIFVCGVPA